MVGVFLKNFFFLEGGLVLWGKMGPARRFFWEFRGNQFFWGKHGAGVFYAAEVVRGVMFFGSVQFRGNLSIGIGQPKFSLFRIQAYPALKPGALFAGLRR